MTAPAAARAPIPAPLEPPRLVSDGRARRADSTRQLHDKWTFVLIPPGTGARPHTLHISVRRLRALFAMAGAIAGGSVIVTAVLGLVISSAPSLEGEYKGVQLGVLAAAPQSTLAPVVPGPVAPAPATELSPVIGAPLVTPMPSAGGAPAVAAGPRVPRAPVAAAPAPRRVAPTILHRPAPTSEVAESRTGSFIGGLPVIGRITSSFSRARRHPLLGVVRRHQGIDIAAPSGTPITAPLAGRVSFAGRKVGFGLVVEIDHGGGVVTRYAHCRSLGVRAGRQVAAGETIAAVGRTGLATGPHLHYEVLVNGRQVDPLRFRIPQSGDSTAAPTSPAPPATSPASAAPTAGIAPAVAPAADSAGPR